MATIIAKPEGGDIKHAQAVAQALGLLEISHTIYPDACAYDAVSNPVIISVGTTALKCLDTLFKLHDFSKACIYWGAHQLMEEDETTLKSLSSQITVIALAQEFNFISGGAHLIKMFGVPTIKLGDAKLREAYDGLTGNGYYQAIDLARDYIIVSLPGDAPDEKGIWREFDKKSAADLAYKTYDLWSQEQESIILVQNGPRTGKFIECVVNASSTMCTHTFLQNIDEAVDGISRYFISELESMGVPVQFYPYARLNNRMISAHNALIYTALKTEAIFIVPGESTSQIKELTQYISDPKRLLVFSPSSQNDGHKKTVDKAYGLGLVSVWGQDCAIQVPSIGSVGSSDLDSIKSFMLNCIEAKHHVMDLCGDADL